jgi:hypothetical protein
VAAAGGGVTLECAIPGCGEDAKTITYGFALCGVCTEYLGEAKIRRTEDIFRVEEYLMACHEIEQVGGLSYTTEGKVRPREVWQATGWGKEAVNRLTERGYECGDWDRARTESRVGED